jgi:chromosome segregation ATPase
MPAQTQLAALEDLERELNALSEGSSGEAPSGKSNDLAEFDEEFREFFEMIGEEQPPWTDGSQTREELVQALEKARQLVADLRGSGNSEQERERRALQVRIRRLEQLRARAQTLLERIDQRLETLRQQLRNLGTAT